MKQLVFMGQKAQDWIFEGHRISFFNPFDYEEKKTFFDAINLEYAYRNKKPSYMKLLEEFKRNFQHVDVLVSNWINPFHPEWLIKHFSNTTKIYGLIDDPAVTYNRTISQIWAFDGAYYVSPSYDEFFSMPDILRQWGISHIHWMPHSSWRYKDDFGKAHIKKVNTSWNHRDRDIIHVGRSYFSKLEPFRKMKKALGKNIHFFGRWQAKGYIGYAAPLKNFQEKIRKQEWQNPGKALYFFPYSVKPISEEKKRELYLRYKIGFNMHYYNQRDIGNSRMYETALFGMMQLCDKAAKGMHEHIFKPDVEIVYYDNIKDAIDKAKFYLKHDNLREKIAKAGFERAIHEYNPNKCFIDLLYWAVNVPRKSKVIEF